ncbi:ciliary-associated calcium-binding coiled-coil protein 1 isoform X1 [Cololabis saira]|uniref:ciliary-associated calcium-binding coiled-coil protein 1 isoform X1 n=1 Tax=Cololabis saira TaxID=129043 RepID=UPI002AD340BE|nr:ciliary-associated calcium-binding coiled-coil protein 1 isoform X1 [Cololabis saira]
MDLVDNLTELSKVLAPACPGVSSGVQSEDEALLDHEEADALMGYIRTSLIQNYTLYEVFFRTPREETLAGLERTIEVFGDAMQPLVEGTCTYLDPQEPPGTLGDPHGPLETLGDPQEPPGTLGDPHGPLETPRDPQEPPVSPIDPQEPPGTSGDHQDPQ